jgi:SWI/SNF-related matrix-associated actin-dependent regulator 1 of chromatin subfamily A
MGTLSYTQNVFVFRCTYTEKEIPKAAKFFFDGRVWKTNNINRALKLRAFADRSAQEIFKSLSITTRECPPLKIPRGLELFPFQVESVTHMLTRNRSYVADDAGLGKTISSIVAYNSDPGKALVICPPFLKLNWAREFKKWEITGARIAWIEKGTDFDPYIMKHSDVIIVPDSLVARPKIQQILIKEKFKWLFIDEAHRFKGQKTKRTVAVFGDSESHSSLCPPLFKVAENVVALSGTPMPNRPIELFPLVNALASEVVGFKSFFEYAERYCDAFEGQHGWDYRGASNLPELGNKLKEKFLIRHRKEEVLKDLPPKTRQIIRLDSPKAIEKYDQRILNEYSIADIVGAIETDHYKDNKMLGILAKYRAETALALIEPSAQFISEILDETNGKVLVFAHHISVVEGLAAALYKYGALKVRGGVSNAARDSIVHEFQNNKHVRVVVGNIQSIGVGFTLTAATRVIFPEFSWVHAENSQAEDRANRIGQTKNVLCQYLIFNELSEYVLNAAMNKEKNNLKVGM